MADPAQADTLLGTVLELKLAGLSLKKIVAEVQSRHPAWDVGSKEVKAVLKEHDRQPQPESDAPPFEIVAIPGMGVGVVATRNIVAGQRLLAESPLLKVAPTYDGEPVLQNIERAAAHMSTMDKASLFNLTQHTARFGDTKSLEGVWMTNALPLDHGYAGVFHQVSQSAITHA